MSPATFMLFQKCNVTVEIEMAIFKHVSYIYIYEKH